MAKYIFQTKTCLKQDIYNTIKTILLDAGWQNITSSYSIDGDVFYSTGESSNLALYMNLRSTSTTNTNDIITTDYNIMSYRFPDTYVPGEVGVGGVPGRTVAQEAWKTLYVAPQTATISKSVTVTIKYHCNKNRIIYAIIYPDASNVYPIINYIGLPDEIYVSTSGSRDMIFCTSGGIGTANTIMTCNVVLSMPSVLQSTAANTYVQLSPKQVNADGKIIMSEIFYGTPSEGMRGKITGIFGLSSTTAVVSSGNIITIGTEQYLILLCGSISYNSFQTQYLAIQIA